MRRHARLAQQSFDAPDLAGTGQEHQHIAVRLAQRTPHARGYGVERMRSDQRAARGSRRARQQRQRASQVANFHRKGAPRHRHDLGIAQQCGHALTIERRRHDQHAKPRAELAPGIERERQAQIGREAALVILVEDQAGDLLERGILLQQPRQHPLGDHFDARGARHARIEPHAIADGVADALAQQRRHAPGHRARRQPARLEHEDLAALDQVLLLQQCQRHQRALARARGRLQHRIAMAAKGRAQGNGERMLTARQQPLRVHFANSSLTPPEMSTEISSSTRGSASPPGEARYLDSHTGLNLAL